MLQTFRCQMHLQCMISPLRDARLVEDAASGVSVHSLPQANANVPPALCAEHDSPMARHDSSNGEIAKPTITTYMHTVLMADLDMIMNCPQSWLMICGQLLTSLNSHRRLDLRRNEKVSAAADHFLSPRACCFVANNDLASCVASSTGNTDW